MGNKMIFSFKDNYADVAVISKGFSYKSIRDVIRISKYAQDRRGAAPYTLDENLIQIQQLIKDNKIKDTKVDIILNWDNIITRVIETAIMSKRELKAFIDNNIEEYFAVSMKEYCYDYEILSVDKSEENKKMNILLAAVQRIKLKEIMDFFKVCNLQPVSISIYPSSILNLFIDECDKSLAVLDINSGKSTLTIIDEGNVFLYSNISNESYKEDEDEFAEIVENLDYFLNFYSTRHFGKKIDNIYIIGEFYNNEKLLSLIKTQSAVDTRAGLDRKSFRVVDKGNVNSILYGDILGYAIPLKSIYNKDINFLNKLNEKEHKEQSENRVIIKEVMVLSAISVSLISATIIYSKVNGIRYDTSKLEKQVMALNIIDGELNKLDMEKSQYKNKVQAMTKMEEEDFNYLKILEAVKKGLPKEIYLRSISLDKDNVKITFSINNSTLDAARAVIAVNNMGVFEPVELPSVKLNDDVKEVTIDLKLKNAHKDVEVSGQK